MQDVARQAVREYVEDHSRAELYLTLAELLHVAERTLGDEVPVRDHGLLQSALARPQASTFGSDAYPTLEEKAAALLHSLARNRALVDGDKRGPEPSRLHAWSLPPRRRSPLVGHCQ